MKYIVVLLTAGLLVFWGCNSASDTKNMHSSPAVYGVKVPQPTDSDMLNPADRPEPSQESREEQIEHIRSLKIAYMTDHLKLTVEESQAFWPVYNKYYEQVMQLQHDEYVTYKKINRSETSSLDDIDTFVGFSEKRINLIRTWSKEFAKVIPENKVAKVFAAEERFKNYLIKTGPWRPKKQQQ